MSAAELYALGGTAVQPLNRHAVRLDSAWQMADTKRLGGTLKIVELAGTAGTPEAAIAELAGSGTFTKKVTFGISVYGNASVNLAAVMKRHLRQRGIAARFVPNQGALSSAQVWHNGLIGDGYEWCLFEDPRVKPGDDGRWWYGQTVWIPDFEGFSKRDFAKPVADTARGMLPPQLARVMINLATHGQDIAVYDPFCGVGGLLLEAVAMGYRTLGSDNQEQAVEGARTNLQWLSGQLEDPSPWDLTVRDATESLPAGEPAVIATEGYLGDPVRQTTSDAEIDRQATKITGLLLKFFGQARQVLRAHDRLVITLPIWKLSRGQRRLDIIAEVRALGYTVIPPLPSDLTEFPVTERKTIEVSRPGARIIHELIVFERN